MTHDPILDAFDHLRRRRGTEPLVVSPSRRATVGEVDALADRLAGDLAERSGPRAGLAPGTPVAFAVCDGVAFLASFLAARRRRLVPVLVDLRAPAPERDRVVRELGCRWLLTCDTPWPSGPGDWTLVAPDRIGPPADHPALAPEVAAVKLSSGSTGRPRGIVTPSTALVADDAALARTMGLVPEERILCAIPMSHSYGLASVAMPALMRGSLVVLADPGSGPFGLFRAAREAAATFLPTIPALLGALTHAARPPELPDSLRLVITAGAPLPPETATRFRRIYGRPVHVFYGSSETGGICFDREGGAGERGTVGEPVEGVRVELEPVGGEAGTGGVGPAGSAEAGVVAVESPAVACGYWPEPHPRLSGGRFRSSDLAVWLETEQAGGRSRELALRGRTDDLVNVRGKKVNPREVEETLAGLPGVREVVAVGADCAPRGETALRVVVAGEAGRLSPAQVVAWCRARLAEHKVPRSVVLVDEIPRTARGKVDRRSLARLAAERAERSRSA
ncbi:MAG: class I adenylate-forming enzyme family protein [Acidobacteriota bacterium]|jgi:long-chain acyl-CoA synthetase